MARDKVPGHGVCSPHARGWSPAALRQAERRRLLPARAGMVPPAPRRSSARRSAPRTRGDGPGFSQRHAEGLTCSPHARGHHHPRSARPSPHPATLPGMTDPQARADLAPDLIRALLRDQHPDLAELPLSLAARGWDNQLWRLGDGLAVRLPWATSSADELLLKEHAWVPGLAPGLPLPVPVPQRLGVPSERFPRPWLVTTWVPGEPGDRVPATRGEEAADGLARFLSALHRVAPGGAPAGRGRGGPLGPYGEHFERALGAVAERGLFVDPDGVRRVWEDAVAAPTGTGPRCGFTGICIPPTC